MSSSFEIGVPPLALQDLDALGLPNPQPVTFKPFDNTYIDGQGQPRGDGYASVTWHFDALTHTQLQVLLDLIGDEQGDDIGITTRTDFGADYAAAFKTYNGYMSRPVFGDAYEIEMGRSVYTDLTFYFTSLVEVVP